VRSNHKDNFVYLVHAFERVYCVTDQCTPIQLHEGLVHPAEPGSGARSNDHHTDAPRRLRFHSKISHHIPHQVL
jgi:hypothetical protein